MPTKYPTLAEVLFLHQRLLERFGGSQGVRDLGLLDSALARPQSGYYTSLSEEAAALLQSLCQNHAFVDGNKRVAFATAAVFLRMNGYRIVATADNAESFMIDDVIKGKASLAEITSWIEAHLQKAP